MNNTQPPALRSGRGMTGQKKHCLRMQVMVLDHVIIGADKYDSFADEGLMK